ncbi:MAG: hypothetical protein ACI4QT_09130 [Kiritimatiellia bacterium]
MTIPDSVTSFGEGAFDGCDQITNVKVVDGEVSIAIHSDWTKQYPDFTAKFGEDFVSAIFKPTGKEDFSGKEMRVWQDFVTGTDPTREEDVFTTAIAFCADGKPVVRYSPELSSAETAKRKYTTYGKVNLTDKEWTPVTEGNEENFNFFTVSVEMR